MQQFPLKIYKKIGLEKRYKKVPPQFMGVFEAWTQG